MEPYRAAAVRRMGLREVPDRELSSWSRAALDAARALGYGEVDMGVPGPPGHGFPLINAVDGRRWNAAPAYLDADTRGRADLEVLGNTLADRLLLRDGRVDGVIVRTDGVPRTLRAGLYVVAGGAFGSPALLMRSGIGPAGPLRDINIAPVLDLPGVGANLSDQPGVFLPLVPTPELNAALVEKEREGEPYVSRVLVRTASEHAPRGRLGPAHSAHRRTAALRLAATGPVRGGVSAFLMKPATRGTVRLRSADPEEPPEIDPAFPSDPDGHDLAVLRSGLATARRFARSAALKGLAALPEGPAAHELPEVEPHARPGTYWHPVGTCAMGPAELPAAPSRSTRLMPHGTDPEER